MGGLNKNADNADAVEWSDKEVSIYQDKMIKVTITARILPEFETNTSLEAPGALAHRLRRCTAFKIQNGRLGAQKQPMESEKVFTPRFMGAPVNFWLVSFLIRALLLWEK